MVEKKLEDFLNISELPRNPELPKSDYETLKTVGKPENLRKIVHDFYPNLDFNYIGQKSIKSDSVERIDITSGKLKKTLYAKVTKREGPLRLALATELNNLFSGRKIKYILYWKEVIVSEKIKGQRFSPKEWESIKNKHTYDLGKLNEFSRILGWIDPYRGNLILRKDGELWNIDFGYSFNHNSREMLWRLSTGLEPNDQKSKTRLKEGIEDGKLIIKNNIESNFTKLKAILDSIDNKTYARLRLETRLDMIHPKEIILKYVSDNGWEELARELQEVN